LGAFSKGGSDPSIPQSCAASHNSSVRAGELLLPLESPVLLIRLTPVIVHSSLPFLRKHTDADGRGEVDVVEIFDPSFLRQFNELPRRSAFGPHAE
jgi:hypothetical protein